MALLAVIGVTAAVTLSVAGDDDGNGSTTTPTASGNTSEIASADDKGPVTVITEDPSCAPARPILETRAATQRNGWIQRDPSIPATAWTPEVRAQYEAVQQSMRGSADQLVPIAKLTPHRVMRELYEQLIAYSRAYADSIPSYTAPDDNLALASVAAASAVTYVCSAITYGSAPARGPLVPALPAPSSVSPLGDPSHPKQFLTEPNSVCSDWDTAWTQFQKDTAAWRETPADIPGSEWTPAQRATNDEVVPVMRRFASELQTLGGRSDNPTLRDFADLSAQYHRAYAQALPTYTPADNYLATAALNSAGVVQAACLAAKE
ncbi:hypothetical protein [Mycobacterium hubeiense]|uniref:hypothetical protein n=1 Tax=Mycobacterium hubeiense TaxID=1867256 RepID=UPI001E32A9F1|nr:hypothetical protein [Mycobacterium sp. QGD 101]